MKTAAPKLTRADAQANRRRILDAAHAHFAAHGPAADMDAIAHEAGVGVGTLYNHFGNKEGLFEAVVLDGLQELEAYLQTLTTEPDPWAAVEKLVRFMAERRVQDRAFGALIASQPTLHTNTRATKRGLGPLIQQILERAKATGQLRATVTPGDIPLLLAGLAESDASPATFERYLSIILDGLRA
jgi:AcrR family transcriptional regulator